MISLKIGRASRNRIERIFLFARTDYFIRYYGSKMGVLWAFINPFVHIMVYYFVFTYLFIRQSDSSFLLYIFTGQISWQFFSEATTQSISIFQSKRHILQNVKINKVDFFISGVASKMYGYFINFLIFFIVYFAFFKFNVGYSIIYLPIVLATWILLTLGIMFILATVYLKFRDLKHFWGVVTATGFWTVPIIWDYNIAFTSYTGLLYNPATCVFINIREIVLHNRVPSNFTLYYSLGISIAIFIIGYFIMYYKSRKALEVL